MDPVLFQNLIRVGKQKGALSADEIAAIAPFDDMSVDEIAMLIADLERAGVSVEIEPKLTRPAQDAGRRTYAPSTLELPEEENARSAELPADSNVNYSQPGRKHVSFGLRTTGILTLVCVLILLLLWLVAR